MNDYNTVLSFFPVFFGVFFSAIEHGERSCCTSPNSKNDALSCLAEPKNAVFYDSAVGPVLVLLYHCAADAQAIVFFFLLKVFPSRDAIGPHELEQQTLSCMDATMSIERLFHTY